ncbi:MAG: hypothetical protein HY795_06650 [Desulfovibrio sp.]|nr:hypothetical protein [Desulfovibrio sp.]MBI4961221.1 hypothetical protein [Desulfovibrio sp.]
MHKRSIFSILAAAVAAVAMLAGALPYACGIAGAQAQERAVSYTRIASGEYQNFVVNWDENTVPVLCALLSFPAQYAAVFHAAPVMGGARPYAPSPQTFEKEQVLVVARVMPAPENMDAVFTVERVVENGTELTLFYRYTAPTTRATYTVKNQLSLLIPKRAYTKVSFYENGKLAGELNTAAGQWCVPAVAPR